MHVISGNDIIIHTTSPSEIAEQLLTLIRFEWNEMVIEDADTGKSIEFVIPGFQTIPHEFFVYENAAMKQLWDDEGACDANANTMFHILLQARQVTVVVDDPLATVNRNVIGAAQGLSRDLFLGRQEFAA